MNRRAFLAQLSILSAAVANAASRLPANRNVKWAVSLALWSHLPPCPFTDILDVMKETRFLGMRLTGFDGFLQHYKLTLAQLHRELFRRDLHIATISFGGPLHDPAQRGKILESARNAMKFLADFGADHLVVFPPGTRQLEGNPARSNARDRHALQPNWRIGRRDGIYRRLAQPFGRNGSDAGRSRPIHVHDGSQALWLVAGHRPFAPCRLQCSRHVQEIQEPDPIYGLQGREVDNPCAGLGGVERQGAAERIAEARFFASIYDLGDGEVDFPGCHRILKDVNYRGWICVDLDTARRGPLISYQRSGAYIVRVLEPIYL